MENKELIRQYVDAAELVEETLADLEELRKKRSIVMDKVRGSNPEFPYEARNFMVAGTAMTYAESDKIRAQEQILENRYEAAVAVKEEAEKFISTAPPRIQRIIRWRYIKGLSWDETAAKMGVKASKDSVRMEIERYLKKN